MQTKTTSFDDYIREGSYEYHDVNSPRSLPSGIPSSIRYDIKLIAWHALYWTGSTPWSITPGRGHSYNVVMFRSGPKLSVRITNYADHREGIAGIR